MRISIDLPDDLLQQMDRLERDRARFLLLAVRNELRRRLALELQKSVDHPHPESRELAGLGLADWGDPDSGDDLLDPEAAIPVEWLPDLGWRRRTA
jgi:hypothetical protein